MKIAGKLNTALFSVMIGSIFGIVLLVQTISSVAEQQVLIDKARSMIILTNNVAYKTNLMMNTSRILEDEQRIWKKAITDYETAMNDFLSDTRLDPYREELAEDLERIKTFWAFSKELFAKVDDLANQINQSEAITMAQKQGFFRIALRASMDPENLSLMYLNIQINNITNEINQLTDTITEFIERVLGTVLETITTESRAKTQAALFLAITVASALAAVGFVVVLVFNNHLAKRIVRIEGYMRNVAGKDLSSQVSDSVKDEVGELTYHLNEATDSISTFITEVKAMVGSMESMKQVMSESSEATSAAITQITENLKSYKSMFDKLEENQNLSIEQVNAIAQSIESLNQNIEDQAQALETASKSIRETNDSIRSITAITNEQNSKTAELVKVIADGGEYVGKTNESINTIAHEITDINEIISIINTISDQTNLLSMNAAIESAHAGEAGKGFSIVAEEIRKLADSTAENAKRIGEIIVSITDQINEAKANSEQSASTFDFIRNDVGEFANAFSRISASMEELHRGSDHILESTETLGDVTRTIRAESSTIGLGAQEIRTVMMDLAHISSEVITGFQEIEAGSNDMIKAQLSLRDVSHTVSAHVEKLYRLTESFKTKDGENTAV